MPAWVAAQYGSPTRGPARERSPRRIAEEFAAAQQHAIGTPVGMTQQQQQVTEAAVTSLAAGVLSVEERISRLEIEAGRVASGMTNVDVRVQGLGGTAQSLTDTMAKFEETMVNMLKQITGTQANLDAFKGHMTNSLAAAENTLTASLSGLSQKVQQSENMIRQVEAMASSTAGMRQGTHTSSGSTNFLPWKT